MTEAEFEAYLKREITREEADERVAWYRQWCKQLEQHNKESPLPDDFIEYVKGRKTLLGATK
jgi:hypothetical protein